MESLFIFGLLIVLAGPIVAIVALVQVSNLSARVASLKRDIEKLSARLDSGPQAEPASAAVAAGMSAASSPPPSPEAAPAAAEGQQGQRDKTQGRAWAAAATPEIVAPLSADAAGEVPRQPVTAAPPRDVENALASRWFVWVGGAAVALGGLLFVKYAHDNGLIPPLLRVIIGIIAAAALVAAGDWARRRSDELAGSYIPAALSAAGIAIAFGVIYAAYALYGILSPAQCFPLLVLIGLGALWLSRRQGPLIAALGLVGSYAAPALVPSDNPSALGFFAYLIVIVAASLWELRSRPWWWLGYAAIAGATLWSLLWLQGSLFDMASVMPIGVFALLMGAAATFVPKGRGILAEDMGTLADPARLADPMRIAFAGLAVMALLLAFLVWQADHATGALIFLAMGMLAVTAFGWWRDGMVAAPLAAALVSLLVLMSWPDVGFHELAMDERGFWVTVPGKLEPFRFRTAMMLALAAFAGIGVAGVWLRREKRPWALLASGSAVLFLFGAWARADNVWPESTWAILAILLAILLVAVADRTRGASERAAEYLLAGIALLGLFAADRLFDGVWQTIAIAALAAAFAYASRRIVLPWVGVIASALMALAAARLFISREFWMEPANLPWGAHWVIYGYGIPAVLSFLSSRWLRQDMFARHRIALEGVALGLAISLVSLELRVLIGGSITHDDASLLELAAHTLAWMGAAYGLAYRQTLFSSFVSLWGARVLLAASLVMCFAMLTLRNPTVTGDSVEGGMLINSLWLAYLAPVLLLALMSRKLEGLGWAWLRDAMGVFALVLLVTFVTLQVKRLFQDATLDMGFETDAESYSVSAAWIGTAIAIFIGGIAIRRQNIRLAGLAILVLAILKVFALDLFELGGLWRIASIIGLGLCLIGVGWLYTRFVQPPKTRPAT